MLEVVAPEVWSAPHHIKLPAGVTLPARMTVVRLPGGQLLLHSPIPIDDRLADELAALGAVGHIVAPNLLHHLHVAAASARYPDARVHAAPGLADKRKDLRIHETLRDDPPSGWGGAFDMAITAEAPKLNEVLMFHRPSRTLVTADYVFNVTRPQGWTTKLALTMLGTRGRLAQSRLYGTYQRSPAARRATASRVLAWDFDRLTMCHGDPVREEARARMEAVLRERA